MGKVVRNNNPFVLDEADKANIPLPQQDGNKKAPKSSTSNAFVLSEDDTQFIKKKPAGSAGETDTSHTPSESELPSKEQINQSVTNLQNDSATKKDVTVLAKTDYGTNRGFNNMNDPEKQLYVDAINGPKKSKLLNSVVEVVNKYYPRTGDPGKDKVREQILTGLQKGDQETIARTRINLVDNLQRKIEERKIALARRAGLDIPGMKKPLPSQKDEELEILQKEQDQVNGVLDDFGRTSLVNTADMEAWLKLDEAHPAMKTSVAAEKLGHELEKRYGIAKTTTNNEYERMRAGFTEIIRNLRMDMNDLLTQGVPSKNPQILKKAYDKATILNRYIDQYNKLDTEQFPDVGMVNTARLIGDVISKTHPNKLIISKQDVLDAAHEQEKKTPGFLNRYGKFVEDVAQSESGGVIGGAKAGMVPKAGLLGGLERGTQNMALDLFEMRANIFGYDADKEQIAALKTAPDLMSTSLAGGVPNKIVFDKDSKAYRELPNENYGKFDWNNSMRIIGEGLPSLIEWVALDKGFGKFAKGALETTALGLGGSEVATGTIKALTGSRELRSLYETMKVSKDAEHTLGLIGATYLTSYDHNHKIAENLVTDSGTMGEVKKTVLANLLTLSTVAAFKMIDYSPSRFVESAIAKAAAPDALHLLQQNTWEKLTADQTGSFIKEQILPRVKAIASKGLESTLQGAKIGAASVLDQKVKDLISIIANKQKANVSSLEDNMHTFTEQTLLMSAIGLPGMVRSGIFPPSAKDALYMAGLFEPQYIDRVKQLMVDGKIETAQGNEMISLIKTMGEEVQKAGITKNKQGLPTITKQKRELAIANFRKRAAELLKQKNGNTDSAAIASEADKEIDNILSETHAINIEDSDVFKSIWGFDGKQPAKLDEIDPVKNYNYRYQGETRTSSGGELIDLLKNSELYEKSTLSQTTKGKSTEGEKGKGTEGEKIGATLTETTSTEGAPLSDLQKKGIDLYNQANTKKKIPNVFAGADPLEFLKMVADQSFGRLASGEKSNIPGAEKEMRKRYGDEMVDVAKDLFPLEEKAPELAPEDKITVNELLDKPVSYKGKRARLYVDGKTIIAKIEGESREYEIGNIDQLGGRTAKELGLEQEQSVVNINEAGDIVVRDSIFKNLYSDPFQAINYDDAGNVISVELSTGKGAKRTFRGPVAEDIAYQIHLKEISNRNEQSEFEQFLNKSGFIRQQIDNARLEASTGERPVEDTSGVSAEPGRPERPIVARHGETDANIKGETGKQNDILNQTGIQQADKLGKELKDQGYTNVVSSDATRAQETAYKVAESTGGSVLDAPILSENLREWDRDKETIDQFAERISKAREQINGLPTDTAVITHGEVMRMLDALDRTDGDIEQAKTLFEKSKEYKNTETYIPSPKKAENGEKTDAQKRQQTIETTEGPQRAETTQRKNDEGKGDVLASDSPTSKEGAEADTAPSLQSRINKLLDTTDKYNKLRKNDPGKSSALNEIRLEASKLGLKVDYAKGHVIIRDEKGNKVQKRSLETNATPAKDFDITSYSDQTKDFVNQVMVNDGMLTGLGVVGFDGRHMSESQKSKAVNDLKAGTVTNGAKAIYDAIEQMHKSGMVELRDNKTGERVGVPFNEYLDTFKEELQPITDMELAELNTFLGEDAFNQVFDDIYETEFATTEESARQPSTEVTKAEPVDTPAAGPGAQTPGSAGKAAETGGKPEEQKAAVTPEGSKQPPIEPPSQPPAGPPPPTTTEPSKIDNPQQRAFSMLRNLMDSQHVPEAIKQGFRDKGLEYKVSNQTEARQAAKGIMGTFGVEESLNQARKELYDGSISSAIYAEAIDHFFDLSNKATDPVEKQKYAQDWANIYNEYNELANQKGKFNAQIYNFYRVSKLGFVLAAREKYNASREKAVLKDEKSIKEAFDDLMQTPEFRELFAKEVKQASEKVKTAPKKEQKKKIADFFDKLKIQTKGKTGSYLLPPDIYNGAIEAMKQAALLGYEVADIVKEGINYISKKHKDDWDAESFEKEYTDQLNSLYTNENINKVKSDDKLKEKVLKKWEKILSKLSPDERRKLLGTALNEIATKGGLEFDQFKQMYADALGLPSLTPEMEGRLMALGGKLDTYSKAQEALQADPSQKNIDAFKKALQEGETASREINDLLGSKGISLDRFLSIMKLNTLGIANLLVNPFFNISYQPIRFLQSLLKTGMDYGLAYSGISKVSGIKENVFFKQRGYFKGFTEGFKRASKGLIEGETTIDYYNRTTRQNIQPLNSVKDIISHYKGEQKLTKGELANAFMEAFPTMGMTAAVISRALQIGDLPFRFAAERAEAENIARQLGLKGEEKEAFILSPSEEYAGRIQDAGERTVMQQANLLSKVLSNIRSVTMREAEKNKMLKTGLGVAKVLGAATQPFLKIPLNSALTVLELAVPEYTVAMGIYKAVQGDRSAALDYFAKAVVGVSIGYAFSQMAAAGVLGGGGDEREKWKSNSFMQQYTGINSINFSGFKRWLRGGSSDYQEGDIVLGLNWLGVPGALMQIHATKYDYLTPQQYEKQKQNEGAVHAYLDELGHRVNKGFVDGLKANVFGNTSTLMDALDGNPNAVKSWLTGTSNVILNSFDPQWLAITGKLQNPYKPDYSAMGITDRVVGNIKDRFFKGGELPSQINVWGERKTDAPKGVNPYSWYFLDITKHQNVDASDFGFNVAALYNRTKNEGVIPSKPHKNLTVKKTSYALTPKQYEEFQIAIGKNRKELVQALMSTYDFQNATDEEKIEMLKKQYSEGYSLGKDEFLIAHPEMDKSEE